ncbi:DUF1990 family protein [Streptomyces sp. DB-54]
MLVNYSADEVRRPSWNIDTHCTTLPAERPGSPEPGGSWEHACRLVRDYEFSPPEIVRALYDPSAPLLGRSMLLEARFHGMHFYCGVRVTEVVDEVRDHTRRIWGWAYETLEGHLERGKVTYEVVKRQDTGEVQFLISCHSQGAPTLDWITLLGWRLFGRRTQLRFYRRCAGNAYRSSSRVHCGASSRCLPSHSGTEVSHARHPTPKCVGWTRWPSSESPQADPSRNAPRRRGTARGMPRSLARTVSGRPAWPVPR